MKLSNKKLSVIKSKKYLKNNNRTESNFVNMHNVFSKYLMIVLGMLFMSGCEMLEEYDFGGRSPGSIFNKNKKDIDGDTEQNIKKITFQKKYDFFGYVAWVKSSENHVLIKPYGSFYDVPMGTTLYSYKISKGVNAKSIKYPPSDKATAVMRLTPLRSGDFLTADILSGSPRVSDSIYRYAYTSKSKENKKIVDKTDSENSEEESNNNSLNNIEKLKPSQGLEETDKKNSEEKIMKNYEDEVNDILAQ